MLSFDCETTGLNLHHGAKPFFITTCDEQGEQLFWEWDVDPLTRQPLIPEGDLGDIRQLLSSLGSDWLIGQNIKFDVAAAATIGIHKWPWHLTHDTLIAGHLLASNQPHDLTSMALHMLGVDIEPFEKSLKRCCEEARRFCRSRFPEWRLAKQGLPEMPSAKESCWKYDTWLPRALAKQCDYPKEHPYWTCLQEYANTDSAVTLPLFLAQQKEIQRRGLWEIYLERLKLLPVICKMERQGVTISKTRLRALQAEYAEESERAGRICATIAAQHKMKCPTCEEDKKKREKAEARGKSPTVRSPYTASPATPRKENPFYTYVEERQEKRKAECPECGGSGEVPYSLTLPKSGNNKSLMEFVYGPLALPISKVGKKSGNPSLDKGVIDLLETSLPENSKQLLFVKSLKAKRKRDTSLAYMKGYEQAWLPLEMQNRLNGVRTNGRHPIFSEDWFVLHPSLNPTGTDTLRMSSSNPNAQNVSRQGMFEGDTHTLRYCFGPAEGRVWLSLDYENIELRIPAFESGERVMIELFEKPDQPPYFGSYHLLNASIIYPELFWPLAEQKGAFKKRYGTTYYQWVKNFGFGFSYSCGEATGDRAAHRVGAFRLVKDNLKEHSRLNHKWIAFARKHGYVETLPDRTVCSSHGYPVWCSRTEYGDISPTVPLNYHIQSTAMWCTAKAMVRCHAQLEKWSVEEGKRYSMVLQVHDELVFDFPADGKENQEKARVLRGLMEKSGEDIGIPLRAAITYNPCNWSEGEDL